MNRLAETNSFDDEERLLRPARIGRSRSRSTMQTEQERTHERLRPAATSCLPGTYRASNGVTLAMTASGRPE